MTCCCHLRVSAARKWCQQGLWTFPLPPEGEGLCTMIAGEEDAVTATCLCNSVWMGITRLASLRAGKCELCFVSLPWQLVLMTIQSCSHLSIAGTSFNISAVGKLCTSVRHRVRNREMGYREVLPSAEPCPLGKEMQSANSVLAALKLWCVEGDQLSCRNGFW